MWYKNVGTSFSRSVTIHTFDRQRDRQMDRNATTIAHSNRVRCSLKTRHANSTDEYYEMIKPE